MSTWSRVPAELVFFEGHFPGQPLLPGVVQLEALVLEEVERVWPELCSLREITRLKFKQPIRPADELELELERHGPGPRVDFVIRRDAAICAQGSLAFQMGTA